jgi:hypothetical protein
MTDGPARLTEKRTLRRKSAGSGVAPPSPARLMGVATPIRHLPASVGKRRHYITFFRDKGWLAASGRAMRIISHLFANGTINI